MRVGPSGSAIRGGEEDPEEHCGRLGSAIGNVFLIVASSSVDIQLCEGKVEVTVLAPKCVL